MSLAQTARRPAAPGGILLLGALGLLWGVSWPALKIVLDEMPLLAFRAICCLVGGAGSLLLARLAGASMRLPRAEILPITLVALLNVTLWQIFMAYGLMLLSAGRASIIAYIMPAVATLFGWLFLKERLTTARLAGLGVSMAGLGVLLGRDLDHLLAAPLGVVLMLGAAASWAGGTVGMKYFRWSLSTMESAGWQFLLGGLPIVAAAIAAHSVPDLGALTPKALVSFVYVLAGPILFCQWAWLKAVEILPGSVSAMGTLAIPVVGTLSGALLLGEALDFWELVALGLVVLGMALTAVRPPVVDR